MKTDYRYNLSLSTNIKASERKHHMIIGLEDRINFLKSNNNARKPYSVVAKHIKLITIRNNWICVHVSARAKKSEKLLTSIQRLLHTEFKFSDSKSYEWNYFTTHGYFAIGKRANDYRCYDKHKSNKPFYGFKTFKFLW